VLGIAAVVVAVTGGAILAVTGGSHNTGSSGRPNAGNLPSFSSVAGLPATLAKARLGSAISLTGLYGGERMSVTVTKVISSARPADQGSAPSAGDRLYAVQFRLDDTGTTTYSDVPSDEAVVVDSAGQSYQSSDGIAAGCQAFPMTEFIAAGSAGLGCVTFDLPTAAKIVAAQFTLDSGAGPQAGQWTLPS
jgi:hypothetical protein